MNTNFSYFTFSVFQGCSFDEFTEVFVMQGFEESFEQKTVSVKKDVLQMSQYINPSYNRLPMKISWWSNPNYPNMVFLVSSDADGLYLRSRRRAAKMKCSLIRISMSVKTPNEPERLFWFQYISPDGKERVVYALREDRWIFYEEGEPLPFENLDYYKRRMIKERIGNDVIIEYLSKLGVNFFDIDSEVSQCMTLERTAWDPD
ncbi:MAG: hypothetical protein K6E86_06565 [Bacteroidales bacterium]|nr:hypothetical protein [Bacteroidales bacterium]